MRTVAVMFILIAHFAAGKYFGGFSEWRLDVVTGTPTVCGCVAET